MSKRKAQIRHARRRIYARHDIIMSKHEIGELSRIIQNKDLPKNKPILHFIKKQSHRVSLWYIWYEDKWLPVVYDKVTKTIVTFLEQVHIGFTPLKPIIDIAPERSD